MQIPEEWTGKHVRFRWDSNSEAMVMCDVVAFISICLLCYVVSLFVFCCKVYQDVSSIVKCTLVIKMPQGIHLYMYTSALALENL